MNAKIGIVGLGVMGSMTMWQLAKKGISVFGFEQFGIAHDQSALGAESRIVRTAYKEGSSYVPFIRESIQLYRELEAETGIRLLTLNGGLMIGEPNTDEFDNIMKSIEEYGIDHEILSKREMKKRFPQHVLYGTDLAVLDKEAGYIRPELTVVTAVKRSEELGAKVFSNTKVQEIVPNNEGVTVVANGYKYKFEQVIITAGPWTEELLPDLKDCLATTRLIMTWYPAKDIDDFIDIKFPIFYRLFGNPRTPPFFGTPSIDRSMVKVATAKTFGTINPNHIDRNVHVNEVTDMNIQVRKFLPGLYPSPVRTSVHMDVWTPDGHPVIGRMEGSEDVLIMTGFSGHGFKMAASMGKVVSDLVQKNRTDHNIMRFAPGRF